MKEQAKISRRKNKSRVGEVVRVLFEGESKESELLVAGKNGDAGARHRWLCADQRCSRWCVPAAGELVNVEITEATRVRSDRKNLQLTERGQLKNPATN